jgi:hypothetical protein
MEDGMNGYRRALCRWRAVAVAIAGLVRLVAVTLPAWFGYIRYGTPILHTDDHRDLAKQAIDFLKKEEAIAADSELMGNRKLIEASCGLLDLAEGEAAAKGGGRLRWDYSHMYDPLADRGMNDRRYINARDEFVDYWNRSKVHQRIGSTDKAFVFLGYCCHLLQDMAVPAHTFCAAHGLRNRISDSLELQSRSRKFRLRWPSGPPYPGDKEMHVDLFRAMAVESRGLEPDDTSEANEIAEVVRTYYRAPDWKDGIWRGSYIGEPYFPYHRLMPSSPRLKWVDLVTLRNFLMERAAARTAQLLRYYCEITGSGK